MTSRTYSVPTISCEHCKHSIETEVNKLTNVSFAEVDIPTRTVRIEGDASDAAVRAAIDEAGYEVADTALYPTGATTAEI
jgi:copper chaperone CopZ